MAKSICYCRKQSRIFAVTIFLIIIVLTPTIIALNGASAKNVSNKPFYVGVTYCGSSVQEAKELIDKVKNYTNLFILQSEPLTKNSAAMDEIGDYACNSNLNYAISGSTHTKHWIYNYLIEAKERWGKQFIGIYYTDEPGGNMLDGQINPMISTDYLSKDGEQITKSIRIEKGRSGEIITYTTELIDGQRSMSVTKYFTDGTIAIQSYPIYINYYPNGTITAYNSETDKTDFFTSENRTQYSIPILPYEQVLKQNPIQTIDDAAEAFVNMNKNRLADINKTQLQKESILVFTADYGLYWWDYKGDFDVILAELAWNHSVAQHIGLVRGAATLQGKSWGTIITWKYTHPPYLTSGAEMFEQMKTSYEAGAEYVIIFNYSEDPTNPNTLQEEHFRALERFWHDVVQNSEVIHGGIKAEAVLVLPQNYGWGMRAKDDNIWGLWPADEATVEIWSQIESKIDQYGLKLDIVFKDSNYPVTGKYDHIYYCGTSQTTFSGLTEFFTSFYMWVIVGALLISVAAGVLLIRFRHRKK